MFTNMAENLQVQTWQRIYRYKHGREFTGTNMAENLQVQTWQRIYRYKHGREFTGAYVSLNETISEPKCFDSISVAAESITKTCLFKYIDNFTSKN